jgi:endonuclease YncB( thermonuclease family)
MICKRMIVVFSIIMIGLFVLAGCPKETVKTDSAISEKRWHVTAEKVEDSGIVLVMSGGQSDKVKLMDIYLPDTSDPQHGNALKYLRDKMLGKELDLKPVTVDGSTTICEIYLESRCVNKDILAEGLAWYFPKHSNYEEWMEVFKKAQLDKKGIWSTSEDQITLPVELSQQFAQKEYLEKMFGSKAFAVMPFYLYHNPYNPRSSYSSSRSSSGMSSKSAEIKNKESELRSVLGSMGSGNLEYIQKKALEAAAIKGELNCLQQSDPSYRPDPNAGLKSRIDDLEFELEQEKFDRKFDQLRK